jgi:hypothetical protein
MHTYSRALVASLGFLLMTACGASTPTAARPSPSAANLTCTSSGQASPSWAASEPPAIPIVSAVVSNDDFILTFRSGTPAFTVQQLTTAHFSQDASGRPVNLSGAAGVRIAMTGFRGDVVNYKGPTTLNSAGPILLQVAPIGDFEGHVSWGAGLSQRGCVNATATGSVLTFHFIPAP